MMSSDYAHPLWRPLPSAVARREAALLCRLRRPVPLRAAAPTSSRHPHLQLHMATDAYSFARLKRRAFAITVTLLNVIAALAMIGLSKPNAAIGTPTAL